MFEAAPNVDFKRGIVGVASTGFQVPGDSQLFILKRDTERLYGSYAVVGGVSAVVPVDLHIAGCPPPPLEILRGLLALLEAAATAGT